jgi:acetolactate synthase-1/2/3 large subunit
MENNVLGLVNEIQHSSYSGPFGVALDHSPDFSLLASAYGIACGTVSEDGDIDGALDQMLRHDGPYLLRCHVDPDAKTGD